MLEGLTEAQRASLRQRLFGRVLKLAEADSDAEDEGEGEEDGCWLWPGARTRYGYGAIWLGCGGARGSGNSSGNGMVIAHRAAYELTYGPIPAGQFVCHRCNNLTCCRPDHLFLGGHAENVANRCAKGHSARGPHQGRAKLTASDIHQIRALLSAGITHRVIARQFAVCFQTIHDIKIRRSWRWLADENGGDDDGGGAELLDA